MPRRKTIAGPLAPLATNARCEVKLPLALLRAAEQFAERHDTTVAAMIRESLAERVGQPVLAIVRGRGKPKVA